jgi:hypothetical protein
MHMLAETIVVVVLICTAISVMAYLMDHPGVLAGILGVAAVLFYITYADLWTMENVGRVMMGLVVVAIVYSVAFEWIPFVWRLWKRIR